MACKDCDFWLKYARNVGVCFWQPKGGSPPSRLNVDMKGNAGTNCPQFKERPHA